MSLDGIGEAHSIIRGKAGFFEKTMRSFETIKRVRKENGYATRIRLKTVVMSHNLHDVGNVAKFASKHENVEVFYQAVEQNYNTPEDSRWFEKSPNWPKDTSQAIAAVKELIQLKREGMPIANSFDQLEVMIPYFENPDSLRVQIQSHQAHEHKALCTALVNMQFLASGDVLACYGQPPVGNIKNGRIRDIWENRPKWWKEGCCLTRRCTDAEKSNLALTTISV
jgi:MoaA/NifB/PqqE/SkfB family radical SAM enzyme